MKADKGKNQKVAAEKGDEQIDGELVLSIEKLQEIQDDLEKINEKASDEVSELEQKYIKVRRPVYDKRKEIIQSIPEFWLTAFLSHPALSQLLTDYNFKYFESLEVEEPNDGKLGYTISFNFNSNPYFEDSKLFKTFNFLDEGTVKVCGKKEWVFPMEKTMRKRETSDPLWKRESEDMYGMNDEIADIIKEDLWPNPLNYFNNDEDVEDEDDEEDSEEDNEEDDDKE